MSRLETVEYGAQRNSVCEDPEANGNLELGQKEVSQGREWEG